jgi:predicted homoserine dehydrogenase-like protein
MNLHRLLQQRAVAGQPVRVGLIGAGKFGSMFLSQVPTLPGLEIAVIADLNPEATGNPTAGIARARAAIAAGKHIVMVVKVKVGDRNGGDRECHRAGGAKRRSSTPVPQASWSEQHLDLSS